MNNKFLLTIIALLIAGFVYLFVYTHFLHNEKVAYIDTAKLMEKYGAMQDVRKKMKEDMAKTQANLDTLTADFEKYLKKHERETNGMSPKEKKLSEELLRTKQNQMVQYQQATRQKMMGQEQQLTQEVIATANNLITDYGKKKHYKIIFATSNGNIAYADKSVDITDEIIEMINKK